MTSDKKNYVKYSLLWPTIVENYGTLINYGKLQYYVKNYVTMKNIMYLWTKIKYYTGIYGTSIYE